MLKSLLFEFTDESAFWILGSEIAIVRKWRIARGGVVRARDRDGRETTIELPYSLDGPDESATAKFYWLKR